MTALFSLTDLIGRAGQRGLLNGYVIFYEVTAGHLAQTMLIIQVSIKVFIHVLLI